MAKLSAKVRKKVSKAEATKSEFEPIKPGRYVATFEELEERTSKAGNEYWNVTFGDITTMSGEKVPGKQWYMVMLPADEMPEDYNPSDRALKNADGDVEAAWANYQGMVEGRMKAFFEAFGYDLTSDTDEMLGERCIIKIAIETINGGARIGEKTNRVQAVSPLPEGFEDGSGDDGDEF